MEKQNSFYRKPVISYYSEVLRRFNCAVDYISGDSHTIELIYTTPEGKNGYPRRKIIFKKNDRGDQWQLESDQPFDVSLNGKCLEAGSKDPLEIEGWNKKYQAMLTGKR